MIIAQISDTHILARSTHCPAGEKRAEHLRRCVADINRQRPDIVVHTGDIVQDGLLEEYAHVREIVAPLTMPLFFIPGNRDRRDTLRAAFSGHTYFPANDEFLHYTVESLDVRLVALDSIAAGEETGDSKGTLCPRRLTWLDDTLSQTPDRQTILLIHQPPFDVGNHYVDGYRHAEEAAHLESLVRRHPQVVRLLCGHVHRSIQVPWADTVASITPSVAVDVRKGISGSLAEDTPVYTLHAMSVDAGMISYSRAVTG